MQKNKYTITFSNHIFNIVKNSVVVNTINFRPSPTGNCQLQNLHNVNAIQLLNDEQIKYILETSNKNSSGKRLYLIEITQKKAFNRLLEFISNNKRYSIFQNNEYNISKTRKNNIIILKFT